MLQGGFVQLRTLEEGAGLLDAVGQGGERGAEQGAELKGPVGGSCSAHAAGACGLIPALGGPEGLQLSQQLLGAAFVQHLAVQPVELVPVEAGAGLVDAIEIEHGGGLCQGEALLHAFRRRPAEQGHVVGQGFGGVSLGAEIVHRGDAITLGELAALLVENQRRVGEHRCSGAERFVEQQLFGGVGDVVFAADHMADGHGGIVHHHHQVVEGIADLIGRSPAGDHHVAAQVGAGPTHLTAHQVAPGDHGVVVDAEADRGLAAFGDVGLLLLGSEVAVAVVVAGGAVLGGLPLAHLGELGFAGVAAVGPTGIEQLLDGSPVLGDAFALDHGIRIPVQAQPLQAFKDVGGVLRLAALLVGVLDAQQELTALAPGEQPVEHRCAGCADVQGAGGAGGETHTHRRSRCCHRLFSCRFETGLTGLEPATSAVTGRCSNRLNYSPMSA